MPQVNRTDFKNFVHMANGGTFTVPIGVSKITVIGAGGAGGGGGGPAGNSAGSPGGVGGFSIASAVEMDVIPGEILSITVGTGGTGGTGGGAVGVPFPTPWPGGGAGSPGVSSSVSRGSVTIVSFPGGAGGSASAATPWPNNGVTGSSGIPATIGFNVLTQSNTYGSSTYNNFNSLVDVSGIGYQSFSRNGGGGGAGFIIIAW